MTWIPSHDQMIQTQLSRNDLVHLIGLPDIAQQVIPGFFIRVLIELPNGEEAYRSYSIRRLSHGRQYSGFSTDRNTSTSWYLELNTPQVLEHLTANPDSVNSPAINGTAFQLNCISNSPISSQEYEMWVNEVPRDPVRPAGLQGFHERRARMVQQMPNLQTGPTRRSSTRVGGPASALPLNGNSQAPPPNQPRDQAAPFQPQQQQQQQAVQQQQQQQQPPPPQAATGAQSRAVQQNSAQQAAAGGSGGGGAVPSRSPVAPQQQQQQQHSNNGSGNLGPSSPAVSLNSTVRNNVDGTYASSPPSADRAADRLQPSGTIVANPSSRSSVAASTVVAGGVGGGAASVVSSSAHQSRSGASAHTTTVGSQPQQRTSGSSVNQDAAPPSDQQREQILAALKRNCIEDQREKRAVFLEPRLYGTTKLATLRTLENDLSDYIDKLREVVQSKKPACVVCMMKIPSVVFLPCRHLALCRSCAVDLVSAKCPLCRETIVELWEPEEL